jgi:hypothetical protein
MKEIAHARIVAITENNLAFEMVFVVLEFFFNIRKLSVKLIFLRVLRGVQVLIERFRRHISFQPLCHGAVAEKKLFTYCDILILVVADGFVPAGEFFLIGAEL